MLDSFRVKNFRGFQDLELKGLRRVNLITGKNNTGKTSLLEALFLNFGPNDPSLTLKLNSIRKYDVGLDPEEVWGWLFFNQKLDVPVELLSTAVTSNSEVRKLEISLVNPKDLVITNDRLGADSSTSPSSFKHLQLTYSPSSPKAHEKKTARASLLADGLRIEGGDAEFFKSLPRAFFLSSTIGNIPDLIHQLSKMIETKKEESIIDQLRLIEPRLKNLKILTRQGKPIIAADLDGMQNLIPVHFMGDGLRRFLDILMAIYWSSGGVLLVDEIENGLHYSVLPQFFKLIEEFATVHDVQIFATTHSWECLSSAVQSVSEENFRMYRLEKPLKEGSMPPIDVVSYDSELLKTSIESGFEVR